MVNSSSAGAHRDSDTSPSQCTATRSPTGRSYAATWSRIGNATSMPTRNPSSAGACDTSSPRDEDRPGPVDVSPLGRRDIDNEGAHGRSNQRPFCVAVSCLSPPCRQLCGAWRDRLARYGRAPTMPRRHTVDRVQRSRRNRNTASVPVRRSHPYRRPITAAIVFALVPWITLGFGSALTFAFAAVFLRGVSRLASAGLWISAALYAAAL